MSSIPPDLTVGADERSLHDGVCNRLNIDETWYQVSRNDRIS
jgi:hypothetical protein